MALAFTASSPLPIHGQEATPEPSGQVVSTTPPLGDCYDGVLSVEPMHCYLLERAEAKDLIDVAAIYNAGGELFIYLRQTGASAMLRLPSSSRRRPKFYEQWPDLAPRGPMCKSSAIMGHQRG